MRSLIGFWSFWTRRGSCGVKAPNYESLRNGEPQAKPYERTSLITLISSQLLEEVVSRWNS